MADYQTFGELVEKHSNRNVRRIVSGEFGITTHTLPLCDAVKDLGEGGGIWGRLILGEIEHIRRRREVFKGMMLHAEWVLAD